jgi:hypothetical protein
MSTNVANATTEFSNCVPVSNGWNMWNLFLFFALNVLAHAATIHPRTGATKMNSFLRMLFMLVAPITAGTVATNAIITFILNVKKFGIKWAVFPKGKESLQNAIPAGAVAISIPKELAPVLAGRWKLVGNQRHSLSLDGQRSHKSKEPHIPTADAKLDFILPSTSRLSGYTDHKFYPASTFTNEFIAALQLVYVIWQIFRDPRDEMQSLGLSSPYVFAVPYLFMSFINLVANIVMPTYSHVVILPPLQTSSTATEVLTTALNVNTTSRDLENASSGQFMRRVIWHIGKRYMWQENTWDERYMSLNYTTRKGERPESDGHTKVQRKILLQQTNPQLAFITWTGWSWFGTIEKSWSRECSPSVELERELELWLKLHYPDIETSIHARPLRIYQLSRYLSVLVTLVVTTVVLGAVTHFRIRVGEVGGKNLYFIYLPQTILLVPSIMLTRSRKTSVGFYAAIEILSSYVLDPSS